MASQRRSQLLALLLLTSMIACSIAWSFLNANQARAEASLSDRVVAVSELEALDATTAGQNAGNSNDLAINRRLRGAAIAARVSDQLASIEPGTAVRLKNSGYTQIPIFVRLNAASLKQLTAFLCEMSTGNDKLATTDIELSLPLVAPPSQSGSEETWTADITFRYLVRD